MTNPYGEVPIEPVDSSRLPVDTDHHPRCHNCNRLLAEFLTRPWRVRCGRCKAVRTALPVPR